MRIAGKRAAEPHPLARDVRDVFHHALRDAVKICREGVWRTLENPETPTHRQTKALNFVVERTDARPAHVGVGLEESIRTLDLGYE